MFDRIDIDKFCEVFRKLPVLKAEYELMDEVTNETVNSLRAYKKMFNISQITVPVNFTPAEIHNYYKVR